jgi:hypothetical protein
LLISCYSSCSAYHINSLSGINIKPQIFIEDFGNNQRT